MNIFRYCISSYKDLMNKNEIKKVIPPGLIWGFTVLKKITKWDPLFVREIKFNNSWSILWFQISLSTLVTLHNKYMRSKDVKNIFERFSLMREMIKVSKNLVLWYILWSKWLMGIWRGVLHYSHQCIFEKSDKSSN